jgi:hypothetical protein
VDFTDKDWSLRFERAALDMQLARAFAYDLMARGEQSDDLRKYAYAAALVVSYGRPFTPVSGWREISQDALPYRKAERAMHARMLDDRRKLWADEGAGFRLAFTGDELHCLLVMIPKAESHF